jgi:hypothetical protein
MTNEQINIAIAKACGWKWTGSGPNKDAHWRRNKNDKTFKRTHELPDYCYDLNAMHEAEDKLEGMNKVEFAIQLCRVVGKDWPSGIGGGSFAHIHATALQKAEAFLRTIGKWEEGGK